MKMNHMRLEMMKKDGKDEPHGLLFLWSVN